MSLARYLDSRFRGDVKFRGAAYLQAERVAITHVTADDLHGVVRDGDEYETHLSRQNGELQMYCACASESSSSKVACKHLWATILAVDEGDYLSGKPTEGQFPPFVTDEDDSPLSPFSFEEDDEESDLLSGESYVPRQTAVRPQATIPRTRPGWEQALVDLRQRMQSPAERSESQPRDREIFYEVDVSASRAAGQLVIQTSQRQRRTNGQWGKLKPLKLRPGKLAEIDTDDDRRILAFLSGGTPERTNWLAQQTESQSAVHRYQIPQELCELILPRMCKTGRTRLLDTTEVGGPTLDWDEGPAWQLALTLRTDEAESVWRLAGELRRDTQRCPVQELELLIPGGLAIQDESILLVDDYGSSAWVDLMNEPQALSGELDDVEELVDRLLDLPHLPHLDLPEALRLEEVRVTPLPVLTITSPRARGWRHERLPGKVEFDYQGMRVRASSRQWAIVQREAGRCLLRETDFEARALERLQQLGFRRLIDQRRGNFDVDIPVTELGRAIRLLATDGWQLLADGHEVREPAQLQLKIRTGIDWFEMTGDVDFQGRTVPFPELLAALARRDSTIRLDDGSLGILPEEWAEQYGLLLGLGTVHDDQLRFSVTQAGLIDALVASQTPLEVDERFAEIREKLQDFQGVEPVREPPDFQGQLRLYQREGLGWLRFLQDYNFGGCLADDMGLGKTVQMLALLLERVETRDEKIPSLVIVPKSLVFNWAHEIERFAPRLTYLEYAGNSRSELREQFAHHDLVLTTYGTLRRDIVDLKDIPFDYIVLDEAQTIKNASSQVAKASRLLQGRHRLALSGTPIENHLGDLWSIFEFLNPGMLGRSSVFKLYATDATTGDAQQALARGLKPFVLRRTKKEVATELPDKFEETLFCDMDEQQRQLYDELREHYRQSLLGMVRDQGIGRTKMHVLEALLRLRQAACHPGLLDPNAIENSSGKLEVLCPHLEELIGEGHKSLVFSQFTSMLSIVQQHLDKRGIRYAYLDGKTRNRKQVVEEFQTNPDIPVFLISLKAGGLGLNLTAAEYVFLLDPWWNPAAEAQAIDRAHRVGQTRQVFAYRLICRDTVEEKIIDLQSRKRKLADAILEADNRVLKDLTSDDLELLLS